MKKAKTTKRALLSAVLALVLCMSMFVGTTFAWFTDSVTSAGNKIVAGNLKIDLELLNESGEWVSIKTNSDPIFKYEKWEPGYTDVKVLKVENEGSLALKWKAMFVSIEGLSELADVIDVYVCPSATALTYPADRDLDGYERVGTVREFVDSINETTHGILKAGECAYLGIALKMQESAGNKYQSLDLGTFDIRIVASQQTSEEDSFGSDYDKFAEVSSVEGMKDAIAAGVNNIDFMGASINLNYGFTKSLIPAGRTVTIYNANVTGRSYGNGVDGTVVFENCTFRNSGAYSIHFDNGAGDVVFKNCTLYGWNSFGSTLTSVSFYDSALYGNGTYALIRSYVDMYMENCTYDISNANHADIYNEGIETVNGAKLTMVNCEQILPAATEELLNSTVGGDIEISEDIVYNNPDPNKQMILETENAISFDGNGKTITSQGANPDNGNHGYVAFVPPAGENVTVSDLTVTGEGFVEMGHYGLGGGDYVANNLVIKDLESTLANGDKGKVLACGFAHYGNATLNNCTMTGTKAMVDGAMPVDAGFVNGTTTVVNGGEYGTIYCWSHAVVTLDGAKVDTLYVAPIKGTVTIKAGTEIGTINVDYGTSSANATRLAKLVIEDGATIGTIAYNGADYTVAEWNAYVAELNA